MTLTKHVFLAINHHEWFKRFDGHLVGLMYAMQGRQAPRMLMGRFRLDGRYFCLTGSPRGYGFKDGQPRHIRGIRRIWIDSLAEDQPLRQKRVGSSGSNHPLVAVGSDGGRMLNQLSLR